ncbi:hypothetical protein A3B87_00980 [Candidatus Kuenenbacteria bacterium RIFCSPHIGHO2_02_FULL_39_13]|uniref:AtpZ/AtpI family protein n=1 Tax=Candidatus Kuenenbacteria bacterium RIFCSPHIGHO2_02_FULL_39_13 TaxID=1798561 RepID=A0A1F6FP69_9BACT|nr:MAG: hypothetical protein A3B87_00980 [Candidatus Kuenenbacteria bacterium RIFCSPHIGHO2_02_FULL_39_13]
MDKNNQNYWLQLGLKIFAESAGWIAAPIIGALYLGQWLDNKYNTAPLFFLGITGLAFVMSSIGIGLTGMKYMKLIEKEEALRKSRDKQQDKKI